MQNIFGFLSSVSRKLVPSIRANSEIDQKDIEFLKEFVSTEKDALSVHMAAQEDERPSVILRQIIRSGAPEAGWFGGNPMLPQDIAWPEIDGVPMCFLAQIDLSKLPASIWSGLGPRAGHLVFFIPNNAGQGKVLHVDGPMVERHAEGSRPWAVWSGSEELERYIKFPVTAIENIGQMPAPIGQIAGYAEGFPHPFDGDEEVVDLTSALHRPFDNKSLNLLIEWLSKAIDMRLRQCAFQLGEDPKSNVRDKLLVIQSSACDTKQIFDAMVQEIISQPFDDGRVASFIDRIVSLPLDHFELVQGPDNTVLDLKTVAISLADPNDRNWAQFYLGGVDRYLFQLFIEDRNRLPEVQRDRIERICEFRADHESGGMSHAPGRFMYTPHGESSPNEVLLELQSSHLNGWLWGDVRSLVFLINREALKEGRFDEVMVDITN